MENLIIKKTIVHILDSNIQIPILSEQEHPLDDSINEFLEKHIMKIMKDDNLREAQFIDSQSKIMQLCTSFCDNSENFNEFTSKTASILFDIMLHYPDIPSADVIICLFDINNTLYLGILKLNYRHSYIHYVESNEDGKLNTIIKQKTTLPSENQKIEECAIINLDDLSIKLLEKQYEINGEKVYYFSKMFLECESKMSTNEKVKLFTKATKKFSKKYLDEDFSKQAEITKAIAESINTKDSIDVVEVAHNVFRKNPELKKEYIDQIEETGLKEKTIIVNEKISERKFKKQKIKTDTGIEINLPIEYYGDDEKVEFLNNADGTISIIIKNINKITD